MTQVARLLDPIVRTVHALPSLAANPSTSAIINDQFGGVNPNMCLYIRGCVDACACVQERSTLSSMHAVINVLIGGIIGFLSQHEHVYFHFMYLHVCVCADVAACA